MKSRTLTWITAMTLGAALATPVWLAAQEQEQQRLETRQQYSVTHLGTAMTLPAQTQQHSNVKFTTLINFDNTNGGNPAGSLIQGRDGNLYGTTFDGGSSTNNICFGIGCGTFFKISPQGRLTTLYNFCSQTNCADGGFPVGPLVLGTDGNFYGTTLSGGANTNNFCFGGFCGVVFKITAGGELTTLYNWCSQPNCADGAYSIFPESGTFVQATDGNFYGTNDVGGNASAGGTAFKLTPSGELTTLYTFCSQTNCTDGMLATGLIQATDGNFYGTTRSFGPHGDGTVFQITPSGMLTTLYGFCAQTNCTDGAIPVAPLLQAADGNFYGTVTQGGAHGQGTVFRVTTEGELTTLYDFCSLANCVDGIGPNSLVQATDGNFYGSTGGSGSSQNGITVFRLTKEGELTTLHTFNDTPFQTPEALFQATNGIFNGATAEGGTSNNCGGLTCGTLFGLAVGLGQFVETVPTAGSVGESVTILGTDLADATHVFFNHTEAAFTVVSRTEIQTSVPPGATTGFVAVTRKAPRLKSNVKFQILP